MTPAEDRTLGAEVASPADVLSRLADLLDVDVEPADERETLHDAIGEVLGLGVSPRLYAVVAALREARRLTCGDT